MTVVVGVLLAIAVGACLLSTVGVIASRDAFDRLHYVGPSAVLGGTALVLAVLAERGVDGVTLRVLVIVVVLQAATALTTHVTARAGQARGDLAEQRGRHDEVIEPW